MSYVILFAFVFAASLLGTGLSRRYALARGLLDHPNERSSHQTPTPRGGGIAMAVAFLAGAAVLAALQLVDTNIAFALLGAGGIVALVGFLDDHDSIAARWRLVAHFSAATWALAWLGGLPDVELLGMTVNLGIAGSVLAAIALVWLLNLYNFMDGIDGIAGIEAFTVCLGAVVLYCMKPSGGAEWVLPALLSVAALGFLIWNFPRSRIFMGDAGSGFLGVTLGILSLEAAIRSPDWLWSWIILLGAFVVDATVTLLRRLGRRERVYNAHRSHAYQHAALRLGRHRPVTLAIGLINILWLLPWALLVGLGHVDGVIGVAVAYAPLVVLAFWLRAGTPST